MKNIHYYFLSLLLMFSVDTRTMESFALSHSDLNKEGKREREREDERELSPASPVLKKTKEIEEQAQPHQAVQVAAFLLELDENDEFENLMRYVREHLSYSYLDDLSLEKIVNSFSGSKEAIERTLELWTGVVAVRWPGQTYYDAFMGYLFLPVQYELNYEPIRSDLLQPLTCVSASYGNALALHYAVELLDIYSLEEESSIEEKKEVKNAASALSSCLELKDGPLYELGLLSICLGKSKKAHEFFKKGFDEKGDRLCGYRHALSTRNLEVKKQVIQKLRETNPVLADLAEESTIENLSERIGLHKKCAEAGFARSYITAGMLLEEVDAEEAQKMYLLAARNHILWGYEKLAELVAKSGNKQKLKGIYKAWGMAGDPIGYIKLGELFLEEGNRNDATACFNRAGIRGIGKRIEHAATCEEGEEVKQELRLYMKDMYDYVVAKIKAGTAVLNRDF